MTEPYAVYLESEKRRVPVSALSPRERRLFGLTKTRRFVSKKAKLKSAPLSAYQAMLIAGNDR